MILAGGRGTRLRSAFRNAPKCMAPIGPRLFLEYILLWLREAEVSDVVLGVGYRRTKLRRWLGDGSRWGVRVSYSAETTPMGTGGALKKAQPFLPKSSFLLLNGDSILDVDLRKLISFHKRRRALATVALARVQDESRYGAVEIDARGRIAAFREKQSSAQPAPDPLPRNRKYINGGVYVMERAVVDAIPKGKPCSLEKDIFPGLVGKGLYGFPASGFFIDIGIPSDYQRAQHEIPERFPR